MTPRRTLLAFLAAVSILAFWGQMKLSRAVAMRAPAIHIANTRLTAIELAGKARPQAASAPIALRPIRNIAAKAVHIKELLARYPDYLDIRHKSALLSAARDYGPAIIALKLPLEKQKQLRELLASRIEAGQVARDELLYEQKRPPSNSQVAASPLVMSVEQQIVDLVGADTWSKLQDSAGAEQIGSTSSYFNAAFADAGLPLSEPESNAIAAALYEVKKQYPDGSQSQDPDPISHLSAADQAVLDRLQGQLNPDQLEVLRRTYSNNNRLRTETGEIRYHFN